MEFTIYDLSELSDDEIESFRFTEHEDLPELEMGLSAGEVRQSLLDRFREEIKSEDVQFINMNLDAHGVSLDKYALEAEKEQELVESEIDNILYDLDDEELDLTVWHFASEVIYVGGEQW